MSLFGRKNKSPVVLSKAEQTQRLAARREGFAKAIEHIYELSHTHDPSCAKFSATDNETDECVCLADRVKEAISGIHFSRAFGPVDENERIKARLLALILQTYGPCICAHTLTGSLGMTDPACVQCLLKGFENTLMPMVLEEITDAKAEAWEEGWNAFVRSGQNSLPNPYDSL